MVVPKLKSHDLYNRLNEYLERGEVLPDFTLQVFSREADNLRSVSAVDSYLIKMIIGVLSGKAGQVLAFAQKASHLLKSASDSDFSVAVFLNCIWLSGNGNQIDVEPWLNFMIGDTADPKKNTSSINFAMKMGYLDWAIAMFDSLVGQENAFDSSNFGFKDIYSIYKGPGVMDKWNEIKTHTEANQDDLIKLLTQYQRALVERFGVAINGASYSVDDDGMLFVEVLVRDSIDPEALTQFNWEMDELMINNTSPIIPHVIFNARYH